MGLNQKVKKLREGKGMSQQDLAVNAGLSMSAVSKLECQRHIPRLDTLEKVASALGISVSDLLAARLQPAA